MTDYFNIEKASASYLKFLEKNNPISLLEWMNRDTGNSSTSLGSLVDCLYTEPELFEETYIVKDKVPSGEAAEIVKEVFVKFFKSHGIMGLSYYAHNIRQICIERDYYKAKASTTGVKKVLELEEYWNFLIEAKGKEIISTALHQEAIKYCNNISRDLPLLNAVLMNQKYTNSQMIIESEIEDIEVKAKLDFVVIVDKEITVENGIVFYPNIIYNVDLKTTSVPLWNCSYEIKKWGYDKSMSFYSYLLSKGENKVKNILLFVNGSGASTFEMSEQLIYNAMWGVEKEHINSYYEYATNSTNKSLGWMNLLEHYKYYLDNGFKQHINLINGIPNLIE